MGPTSEVTKYFYAGPINRPNHTVKGFEEHISPTHGNIDLRNAVIHDGCMDTYQGLSEELIEKYRQIALQNSEINTKIRNLIKGKHLFQNNDLNWTEGNVCVSRFTDGKIVYWQNSADRDLNLTNDQRKLSSLVHNASISRGSFLHVDTTSSAKNVTMGKGSRVYVFSGSNADNLQVGDHCFVYLRNYKYTNSSVDGGNLVGNIFLTDPNLLEEAQEDYQKKLEEYREFQIKNIEQVTQLTRKELGL